MTSAQKLPAAQFECHSELLQNMAQTIGVNLGKAVLRDELRYFPFRDMVFRCSRCPQVQACQDWLAAPKETAVETPDYCRNKGALERLRPAT